MDIVCFEMNDNEADVLIGADDDNNYTIVKETLNEENASQYNKADIISCFIYSNMSAAVLEMMPHVKLIATRSTGVDHIDLDYCWRKGITVVNVPDYGEHTIAEHVFALLLSISRHIPEAVQRTRNGNFSYQGLCGFDLHGKTIGIIGTGGIGQHTAKIAKGFGMNVLCYDLFPKDNVDLPYVSLHELLHQADVISMHVPGTPQTYHMLSEKQFSLMKDGVVIINTARGSVIDTNALLRALYSKKVAFAGLDVLPGEAAIHSDDAKTAVLHSKKSDMQTILMDYSLMQEANVLITPHSAFYTKEAMEKILSATSCNIAAFIDKNPQNVILK